MNILFESAITEEIKNKYILLPLDTFYFKSSNRTETAYCLVENTPILEMMSVDHYRNLHLKLMENYQKGNWQFCENAIEHLIGRWSGEVDSFYSDMVSRINKLKNQDNKNWSSTITIADSN